MINSGRAGILSAIGTHAAVIVFAWYAAAGVSASPGADPALEAFRQRVKAYAALRARLAASMPLLQHSDTPVQIVAREHALAQAVEQARAGAREGEVFGSAASFFTAELRADWQSRSPREQAGLLRELPPGYRPKVNTVYPTTFPLATFPPTLLRRLPELPDGLEYRIVGPHLILRDATSNLIVDVLPNVLTTGDNLERSR